FRSNLDQKISDIGSGSDYVGKTVEYHTFDEGGNRKTHEINIDNDDTIGSVLAKITNGDSPVRAFFDGDNDNNGRIVLETTRTGTYNTGDDYGGAEIGFNEGSFFTEVLQLTAGKAAEDDENSPGEIGGQNAKFIYNNGLDLESRENSYTINN